VEVAKVEFCAKNERQNEMKRRLVKAPADQTLYIEPGSPWEQAYIESFHDKLRDECLNRELFSSLAEARIILEGWRVEYNEQRPHSALGYLTPVEFAAASKKEKWEVVSKDLNNPKRLFTTGPARAGQLCECELVVKLIGNFVYNL
jgi:putative transposase